MSQSRSGSGTFNRNPKMQHLMVPGQKSSNRSSPYTTPISSPHKNKSPKPVNKNSTNQNPDFSDSLITVIQEEPGQDSPRKRIFKKEITQMMHGFGEKNSPYEESVNLLSDIMENFIADMAKQAVQVGKPGKLHIEDILYLVRHDAKKNSRACGLSMYSLP